MLLLEDDFGFRAELMGFTLKTSCERNVEVEVRNADHILKILEKKVLNSRGENLESKMSTYEKEFFVFVFNTNVKRQKKQSIKFSAVI